MKNIFVRSFKNGSIPKQYINIGYNLFEACLYHVVFSFKKTNDVSPKDMVNAILTAIHYNDLEQKI